MQRQIVASGRERQIFHHYEWIDFLSVSKVFFSHVQYEAGLRPAGETGTLFATHMIAWASHSFVLCFSRIKSYALFHHHRRGFMIFLPWGCNLKKKPRFCCRYHYYRVSNNITTRSWASAIRSVDGTSAESVKYPAIGL